MSKSYVATRDGFIAGNHYTAGSLVPITEKAAKYLSAPYSDDLTEVKPEKTTRASGTKTKIEQPQDEKEK